MKDNRKRMRCKVCGKRVSLATKRQGNKILMTCPNCLSQYEDVYKERYVFRVKIRRK